MIRYLLLGAGVTLLILGAVRLIYEFGRHKGTNEPYKTANKKGLLAAIGAVLLGIVLIYRNTRKD